MSTDPTVDPTAESTVPHHTVPTPTRHDPSNASGQTVYLSHRLYRVGVGICLLLAVFFAWELGRSMLGGTMTDDTGGDGIMGTVGDSPVEVGTLLFLGLAVGLMLRNVWMTLCRVEVDAAHVTLRRPLLRPRRVAYRQLAGVYEEGRGLKAILLAYHPQRADGLYELDELSTLALPAVDDHASLYAMLAADAPSTSP